MLLPDIRNGFYSNILYGMDTIVSQQGYNLFIASTYSDIDRERRLISFLNQKLADGVIFLHSTLEESELEQMDRKFPIVQCCEFNEGTMITNIAIDNFKAGYDATRHLISQGHKRIAFLSSNNGFLSTKLREAGYKSALQDNSLEVDDRLLIRGRYSFESGYVGTNALMNYSRPPTAIFTISDVVASGAIRALYQLGKSVPKDVAVFGFDNIDLARQLTPALSTIAQPLQLLGGMAVKTLLDKIDRKDVPNKIVLPYELVIRDST